MSANLYEQWRKSCEHQDTPEAEAYRQAAKDIHQIEGEIEVDDGAIVSYSADNGAYVMAWVWVNAEELANYGVKPENADTPATLVP